MPLSRDLDYTGFAAPCELELLYDKERNKYHMLFDERLLGANATLETRDAWANETWPQIKLIWAWMILLHFAALLPLDPVVLHWLSVLLRRVSDTATPVVSLPEYYQL
ncbi:hypothetical protein BAUCODRAFT_479674 [Baudoinia panamericana UAMH 10762]|uniref:Uncharacterized protein n=1 Tax=Baudoinia panamericana (strain UAMH 10762) TaxID=717646 RepID=M2MYA5_BAUPA|nr:uncharacterized protein BAUCODRAFT_479674 [Baudoinia panamericana UAMH 10762]EMC96543.1 hypothetical protein BAUCODRAFT_479674 [Baudoinia panamericana UAMH 10762]